DGRLPFGPERLHSVLTELSTAGRLIAVDRDWYLHPESHARLRSRALDTLAQFHRANPLKPGMSREELRGRIGAPEERMYAHLLTTLEAEGSLRAERDKVRLASHEVRLSPEQQRIVDPLQEPFLTAAPPP